VLPLYSVDACPPQRTYVYFVYLHLQSHNFLIYKDPCYYHLTMSQLNQLSEKVYMFNESINCLKPSNLLAILLVFRCIIEKFILLLLALFSCLLKSLGR
jgi:hypothetical protein